MNLGAPELIIILLIAVLVFGGAKLPKLARSLGQAQRVAVHVRRAERIPPRHEVPAAASLLDPPAIGPLDGPVDRVLIQKGDRELFLQATVGEHVRAEGVAYVKGRHVKVTAPGGQAVPMQVDGDPAGHTPAEIDLLPIRLPFIVPADAKKSG